MKFIQSKLALFTLFLLQITAVGALDYLSGYELRIGALYAVPIAFATWYLGVSMGVVASVAAAAVTFWAEIATGEIYSREWIGYVNCLSRLAIFLFVAFSFSYFHRTIDIARKRVRAFAGTLPICSCCHRVDGGDGFWVDFPTYVRTRSEAVPEFRVCPLCVKENRKEKQC